MKLALVDKLCEASTKLELSPYRDFVWPETFEPQVHWAMSPEFISLAGLPEFKNLSESQQKRLSFFECVNFFSLNIHGEKPLIQGLADRLYRESFSGVASYLHHFLGEENNHMVYFGTFCQKYAGKIYRDKKLNFPRSFEPGEEDFLFFVKVMIFEEIVDYYNSAMAKDARLEMSVREINRRHHVDEARHLAFGRQMVKELFTQYSQQWKPETLERLRQYVSDYLVVTWKEYYNPEVYEDAGLSEAYDLAERAFESPMARAHRKEVSKSCIQFLLTHKMILEEPAL